MILKAENISKKYDEREVLTDASMEIYEGEFISVLGESGIGKSTFAKIICGSIPADRGSYTALGLEVQMVYQQPWSALDPNQRIGKGFEELIRYHHFAQSKDEIKKLISEKLSMVELKEDILSHLPRQISGGEAQRVCIARALLFNPKLLILDEATSMLDVKTQQEIISLVKRLICKKGGAVLLITHDRELAERSSDRIYEISDGKMIQR